MLLLGLPRLLCSRFPFLEKTVSNDSSFGPPPTPGVRRFILIQMLNAIALKVLHLIFGGLNFISALLFKMLFELLIHQVDKAAAFLRGENRPHQRQDAKDAAQTPKDFDDHLYLTGEIRAGVVETAHPI